MFNAGQDRFSKVIKKLNSSSEDRNSNILPQSSTQNSFFNQASIGFSDKSSKLASQYKPKSTKLLPMNQQSVLQILFQTKDVFINRIKNRITTQFIPTSNGLKYVLVMNDFYVNLSWLHSVQQLQKTKVLILYYDMSQIVNEKPPKIQSLIIQFNRQIQMIQFLSAVSFIHNKSHDQDVEKLYHQFC